MHPISMKSSSDKLNPVPTGHQRRSLPVEDWRETECAVPIRRGSSSRLGSFQRARRAGGDFHYSGDGRTAVTRGNPTERNIMI